MFNLLSGLNMESYGTTANQARFEQIQNRSNIYIKVFIGHGRAINILDHGRVINIFGHERALIFLAIGRP